MQMLGFVPFIVLGLTALTTLSVSLYAVLPKTMLECAERHGRFQGLQTRERLTAGTPAGDPPMGSVLLGVEQ